MVQTRKREPAGTPEKQKASRTSKRISARKSNKNETEKEKLQQKVSLNEKIDKDNDKMTDNDNVDKSIGGTKTIIALPDEDDKDLAPTPNSNDTTSTEEAGDETKPESITNNNDHNNDYNNDNKNNEDDNKEDNFKEKEILLEDENFTEEEIAFFNETDDEDFNPSDNNQKDVKLITDDIEDYNDLRELDNEFIEYDAARIYKKEEEERKRLQPEDDVDLMMLEEDLVANLDKKFEAQEDKIKKHVSIIDKNSDIEESEIKKQKKKEANPNTLIKLHTKNNDNFKRNTIAKTLPNIKDECRFKAVIELPPSKAPMKDLTELIKKAFKAIRDKGGDAIGIAPWNETNSNKDDKVWTSPKHIPSGPGSKTTLAKYLSS